MRGERKPAINMKKCRLMFIIEKPEIKKHMKTGNQTQVMMILEEMFSIYHKRLEMNSIKNKNE